MPLGVEQVVRGVLNRSRRGLYGGRTILSGNMISEDGKNKTRRVWKPNAQRKNLFSDILNRNVRLRITTACLRTIDKYGGLDNYLQATPDAKLDSDVGSALKREVADALRAQRARATAQLFVTDAATAAPAEAAAGSSAEPAAGSPAGPAGGMPAGSAAGTPAKSAKSPSEAFVRDSGADSPAGLAEAAAAGAAALASSPADGAAAVAGLDAAVAGSNPLSWSSGAAGQREEPAGGSAALDNPGETPSGAPDPGVADATTSLGAAWLPEAAAAAAAAKEAVADAEAEAAAAERARRERVGWGLKCRPKRMRLGVRRTQKPAQWQAPLPAR